MAFFRGPNIVTDGLIFALDAGNTECFTSGNTTATCLVSGFNCSGANGHPAAGTHTPNTANFPVYNSTKGGVFDFVGGKGINIWKFRKYNIFSNLYVALQKLFCYSIYNR